MQIMPVGNVRSAWPAMARIMQGAWPDWYGLGGQGDAMADLQARSQGARPAGWIAFVDGNPVATVALYDTSFGAEGSEGPWLTGLVTTPELRGRGIAADLVAHVEGMVDGEIYTTTREAAPIFLRRGWQVLRDIDDGWKVLRLH